MDNQMIARRTSPRLCATALLLALTFLAGSSIGVSGATTSGSLGHGSIIFDQGTFVGPETILFYQSGCKTSQWDGEFGAVINVSKYIGSRLLLNPTGELAGPNPVSWYVAGFSQCLPLVPPTGTSTNQLTVVYWQRYDSPATSNPAGARYITVKTPYIYISEQAGAAPNRTVKAGFQLFCCV